MITILSLIWSGETKTSWDAFSFSNLEFPMEEFHDTPWGSSATKLLADKILSIKLQTLLVVRYSSLQSNELMVLVEYRP